MRETGISDEEIAKLLGYSSVLGLNVWKKRNGVE